MSDDKPKTIWVAFIATVVSAIISSIGLIVAHNWDRFFLTDIIVGPVDVSQEEVRETPQPEKERGLGKLEELEPETVYIAETDGFVVAYTGGNNPANLATILMGTERTSLVYCSRMHSYDGATCPVPKGSYWIVRDYEKKGGQITVRWIPLIQ